MAEYTTSLESKVLKKYKITSLPAMLIFDENNNPTKYDGEMKY